MGLMRYQPQGRGELAPWLAAAGCRLAFSAGLQTDAASGLPTKNAFKTAGYSLGQVVGPLGTFDPYPTFGTFPVKRSGSFTVVVFGDFRATVNKTPLVSHSNGSVGGWKFTTNGSTFGYTQYGVADYAFTTRIDSFAGGSIGVVALVVTPGVNAKIYIDGKLASTISVGAMNASSGNGAIGIGQRPISTDSAGPTVSMLAGAYYVDSALADDQIIALSQNFWAGMASVPDDEEVSPAGDPSGLTLTPMAAALSLAGYAPSVNQPQGIAPGNASLSLTGYAPAIGQAAVLSPSGAALALSGYAPAIIQPQSISPAGRSLSIAGYAPQVEQAAPQTVEPGPASFALTGYAPSVGQVAPVTLAPNGSAFTLAGFAPMVAQGVIPEESGVVGGGGAGGGGSVRDVRAFADLLDSARKPSRSQKKARRRELEAEALELLPDLPEAEALAPIAARIVYEQEAKAMAPLYADRPISAMAPVIVPFDAHAALRELVNKLLADEEMQRKIAEEEENDIHLLLFGT